MATMTGAPLSIRGPSLWIKLARVVSEIFN
jgi:hypothetical protein